MTGIDTRTDDALVNQILDIAQESFIAHGFQGTKMEQLARKVGCSVGQIYHVFANKEALFLGVHERAHRVLLDDYMDPALDAQGDSLSRLIAAFRAYVQFYIDHREMGPLLAAGDYHDRPDESMERVITRMNVEIVTRLGRLRETIVEGIEKGELRQMDPTVTVRWWWGAVFGVLALNVRFPSVALDEGQLGEVIDYGVQAMADFLRA